MHKKKFGNCNKPWRREKEKEEESARKKYPNPYHCSAGGAGSSSSDTTGLRPPPHLKGKAIGLWYRDHSLALQKNQEDDRRMTVFLNPDKREHIEQILDSVTAPVFNIVTDPNNFDHINESKFKNNFLKKIQGTFEESLEKVISPDVDFLRDTSLDSKLKDDLERKYHSNKKEHRDMLEFRRKLPAYKKRQEILSAVEKNQVIIISGETGCGKTTQVAQYILDDFILKEKGSLCHVVCTQPRRISAISVAERVAAERGENLGDSVGFQIRLEKVMPSRHRGTILFVTTGILLQWMHSDPAFTGISHLVIDEIHERDTMCDFLLAFIKDIIQKRPTLKVILMSATLNAVNFAKYYNGVPEVHIQGFTYPVQEYYLEDIVTMTNFKFVFRERRNNNHKKYHGDATFTNYILPYLRNIETNEKYSKLAIQQLKNPDSENINIDLIQSVIMYICKHESDGAILVFVPGLSQIQDLSTKLTKTSFFSSSRYMIIPLHSIMPTTNQKQVFRRPPPGVRKIVIATNIAETSITIDDVVFVIDCGKNKVTNLDIKLNVSTLEAQWETAANAKQRRGRAGRVQPGKCYYLFTKARHEVFEPYPIPEIQRTRLEEVVLQAKMLQLGKVAPFLDRLMDPPDPSAVQLSLQMLTRLNALDSEEKLTPLGYHLAKLPMDPQTGKMILMGALFSCVDPIFSIAASLNFKDPFVIPLGKERLVDRQKEELAGGEKSDHLVLSEALCQWEEAEKQRFGSEFAWKNYLSVHTLKLLKGMKEQFAKHLYEMNYTSSSNVKDPRCNVNSNNIPLLKAIICSGLYPNVAMIKKQGKPVFRTAEQLRVELHPKSLCSKLTRFESNFFVFHQILKSSAVFIHDVTMVNPLALLFFGEKIDILEENKMCMIKVDSLIKFNCFKKTALLVKKLRMHLDSILENKITNPQRLDWSSPNKDIRVLEAIVELITSEDSEMDY